MNRFSKKFQLAKKTFELIYYVSMCLSISFSLIQILKGLSSPFGELQILLGLISLLLLPIGLRFLFSQLFYFLYHDKR
jgi:hypothetical protein